MTRALFYVLPMLRLKPFAFLFQADERIARYLPFPQLQIWRLPGKTNRGGTFYIL
jgi:hypothetical protein